MPSNVVRNFLANCIFTPIESPEEKEKYKSQIKLFETSLITDSCRGGRFNILKHCSNAQVDFNLSDFKGWSLLQVSCYFGRLDIARWLISDRKVRYKHSSSDGMNPLLCAVLGGHLEIVEYLIDEVALISVFKCQPVNALHLL